MELCEIFKMISVYIALAATINLYFPLYIFSVSNQSIFFLNKAHQIRNQVLFIQTDHIHKTSNLVRYQVSQ